MTTRPARRPQPKAALALACLAAMCVGCATAERRDTDSSFSRTARPNLGAILTEDESVAPRLSASLDAFLDAVLLGEISEDHISSEDQQRHTFFMRALRGLGGRSDGVTHEPLLLKSYPIEHSDDHLVTVAFLRDSDAGPEIYRIIEFHAEPYADGYRFRSPFEHRTRSMRSRTVGDVRYRFNQPLDTDRAERFVAFKQQLSSDVGVASEPLDYYRFDSLDELLTAHGLIYDAGKCNWLTHDLGFTDDRGRIYATGTGDERYIFEFVRSFIFQHCDAGERLYPPFVAGMAAYFGGYSLSGDDMPTLKAQFRAELAQNPDINFLDEFDKGRKSSIERHFTYFVICAFVCEAAIEHGGFDAALELARSGERFFDVLESTLGVGRDGLHDFVLDAIGAEG